MTARRGIGARKISQVYRYRWQKNWPWYLAWGRLSYNPQLADETLIGTYRTHFPGRGRGGVQRACRRAGRSCRWRWRIASMDLTSGICRPKRRPPLLTRRAARTVTPLSFAINTPMDQRSFIGIDEYVERKVGGVTDSRVGPPAIAEIMERAAGETRHAVAEPQTRS